MQASVTTLSPALAAQPFAKSDIRAHPVVRQVRPEPSTCSAQSRSPAVREALHQRFLSCPPIPSAPELSNRPQAHRDAHGERDVFSRVLKRSLGHVIQRKLGRRSCLGTGRKARLGPTAILDARGLAHIFWKGTDWAALRDVGRNDVWTPSGPYNSGHDRVGASRRGSLGRQLGRLLAGPDRQTLVGHEHPRFAIGSLPAGKLHGAGTLASAPTAVLDAGVEDVCTGGAPTASCGRCQAQLIHTRDRTG